MFNRRRNSRGSRSSSPAIVFEALEQRALLSGTVTVQMVGQNLVITGDDTDNDIIIDADEVKSGTTSATTIVGTATPSSVKGDIIIKMLGGPDIVYINVPTILGNLKFDGGDGNTQLTIEDTTVKKSVSIANGAGFDSVTMTGTSILGALTITNGTGGSVCSLIDLHVAGAMSVTNGSAAPNPVNNLTLSGSVGKTLKITNGDAASNFVSLDNAHINGAITVKNGAGDDVVQAGGPTTIGGALTIAGGAGDLITGVFSSVIGGNLTASTGGAIDLTLVSSSINGTAKISGGGNNTVVLANSMVLKDFGFTGVGGIDSVRIDSSGIGGNVGINVGAGDNDFSVSGNTSLHGNLTYTGTDGVDTLNLGGAIGKNATLNLGGGADSVVANGLIVLGSLKVAGGAGNDIMDIDNCEVVKTTTVDLGDGDDTITVDDSTFVGAVKVITGAGSDSVSVERDSDADGTITTMGASLTLLSGGDTIRLGTAGNAGNQVFVGGALTINSGGLPNDLLQDNLLVLGTRTIV